jgi:hypothetical protein
MQEIIGSSSSGSWTLWLLILSAIIPSSIQEMVASSSSSTGTSTNTYHNRHRYDHPAAASVIATATSKIFEKNTTTVDNGDSDGISSEHVHYLLRRHPKQQQQQQEEEEEEKLHQPQINCYNDMFTMEMQLLCHYYSQY